MTRLMLFSHCILLGMVEIDVSVIFFDICLNQMESVPTSEMSVCFHRDYTVLYTRRLSFSYSPP